jgi:hypothetical protein
MPFHHFAHFDQMVVKKGDKVKKGQLIGYMGTTGASSHPHLHYEVKREKPNHWTQYTAGMTKEQVAQAYIDANRYIDKENLIPCRYDRYKGYDFLDKLDGKNQYHPGVDLNWGTNGWSDFRSPILSPIDGEVLFVDHDGHNGGWGDHMWIEEIETEIDMDFAKSLARQKWGFYLQVEEHGELWAVNEEGYREYIHPDNLMDWLRKQAVGISNEDLSKVPIKK